MVVGQVALPALWRAARRVFRRQAARAVVDVNGGLGGRSRHRLAYPPSLSIIIVLHHIGAVGHLHHVVFAVILQLPDVGMVLQVAGRVVCVGRQGRAGTIFRQVVMFVLRGSL